MSSEDSGENLDLALTSSDSEDDKIEKQIKKQSKSQSKSSRSQSQSRSRSSSYSDTDTDTDTNTNTFSTSQSDKEDQIENIQKEPFNQVESDDSKQIQNEEIKKDVEISEKKIEEKTENLQINETKKSEKQETKTKISNNEQKSTDLVEQKTKQESIKKTDKKSKTKQPKKNVKKKDKKKEETKETKPKEKQEEKEKPKVESLSSDSEDDEFKDTFLTEALENKENKGPYFSISLEKGQRIKKGKKDKVVYRVKYRDTKTGMGHFLEREYEDFIWLMANLRAEAPEFIIPVIPDNISRKQFKENIPESLRVLLERFLVRISNHSVLPYSKCVSLFFQTEDSVFLQKQKYGKGKVERNVDEEEEFHKWIKVYIGENPSVDAEYISKKQKEFSTLEKSTDKLIKMMNNLTEIKSGFGTSYQQFPDSLLSVIERLSSNEKIDTFWISFTETISFVASLLLERSNQERTVVEEQIAEFKRQNDGCKPAFSYYDKLLSQYLKLTKEFESKKTKFQKLSGQGVKEEKAQEDLVKIEKSLDLIKDKYNQVCAVLIKEIQGFEYKSQQDFQNLFLDYAMSQFAFERGILVLWEKFVQIQEKMANLKRKMKQK
eukprot:Anaeramoba_ignava/a348829_97.p1 GENE.a348829_97~~a348829_97.p1  ORF type:complete len:604 (-),score=202.85 a348829_97:79-1890(-)